MNNNLLASSNQSYDKLKTEIVDEQILKPKVAKKGLFRSSLFSDMNKGQYNFEENRKAVTQKRRKIFDNWRVKLEFTAYAPMVFKYIRQMDNINDEDLIHSLDPETNRQQIFMTN